MTVTARCLLCSKIIVSPDNDTSIFLDHIRTAHSEILILDSKTNIANKKDEIAIEGKSNETSRKEEKKSVRPQGEKIDGTNTEGSMKEKTMNKTEKSKEPNTDEHGTRVIYTSKLAQKPPKMKYKTSIQKWSPAKGCVYCPKCGCTKRPNIRSHSEKVSDSTFGAAILLSCWPFCFLPWGFQQPSKEYLHCPVCNNFLGLYDRQTDSVRPNREFCEENAGASMKHPDQCSRLGYKKHFDFSVGANDNTNSQPKNQDKKDDKETVKVKTESKEKDQKGKDHKEKDKKEKDKKEKDQKDKDHKEKDHKEKDKKEKDKKEKDQKDKDHKEKDHKEKEHKEKDHKEKDHKEKDHKEKEHKEKEHKEKEHKEKDVKEKDHKENDQKENDQKENDQKEKDH